MKTRKSLKAVLSLAVVVAMLCALSVSAFAASTTTLDTSQTGSISVSLSGETDGTLSLYKVASIDLDNGDMVYNFTDAFLGSSVSLDDLSSDLAFYLYEWVDAYDIESNGTAAINESGEAEFTSLGLGLYLIIQTGSSTGYTDINPFLVTIPIEEGNDWVYDVDASPKVEAGTAVEPEPTPSEEPEPSEYPEPSESPEPSEEPEPSPSEDVETSPSPSTSTTPVPSTSTSVSPSPSEETLPQTGQLNWPISVLASIGAVLIIVGCATLAVGKKQRNAK